MIAAIIGVIAVGCMIAGARMLGQRRGTDGLTDRERKRMARRYAKTIGRRRDDLMAVADAVQQPRRLCPPPRGPDDDPDFMNSLRGPQ